VFVAPDAGLNLISFSTLIDTTGEYLIERFPIHYLSAGRDLIRLQDKPESGLGLLALGDPDFNATITQRQEKPEPTTIAVADVDNPYARRSFRSGCGELSELEVTALPATRKEIDRIVERWSSKNVSTLLGPQTSEDNFKSLASGKRVIHLATHGYFLEGKCNPDIQLELLDQNYTFVGENPFLLSGLLFAGANLHGAGADSVQMEDGVLSAYEVSALNLSGVDMVVLSACETGLDEVKQGEGIYGLRRTFQIAGARTVISSLWPVDDKLTASMMSELYQKNTETIPEKLRRVQLAQIKKLRKAKLADHPFIWGAWVAIGDWR
jgi:CHAT domain-containing protein